MPSGVYIRTDYHRKITSNGIKKWMKENPNKDKSWKKGHIPWNKNKLLGKYTDGRGDKISKALTGHISPKKGTTLSVQIKLKVKNAITEKWKDEIYRNKLSGSNAHYYKGGSKFVKDYGGEFTKKLHYNIRERDNFQCQNCLLLEKDRKHSVHHIDLNKKNNSLINLILLCPKCHQEEHIRIRKKQGYYLKKGSETIIRTPNSG